MKKIGIVTPIYNEEDNLPIYYQTLTNILGSLSEYEYEILLIDNCSHDGSQAYIRNICKKDPHVKAIFNIRNFGFNNSVYHGLVNSEGDCVVLINCDLQDPPDMIPKFLEEWENGYKVILGIKESSDENKWMVLKRRFYYRVVDLLSDKKQVLFHTGFGLYDRKFIEILKELNDPAPYLKELVSSFSFRTKELYYKQRERVRGQGSTSLYTLYDDAMVGLTKTSKKMMRLAIFGGMAMGIICILLALIQFVLKLVHPDWFADGIAFIAVGVFLLAAIQLFFIGILGEYILTLNSKATGRSAVYEEERINFDQKIKT